mgnify:CR=1 FL=1
MHFSKFTEALQAAEYVVKRTTRPEPEILNTAIAAAYALRCGQRFYFPDSQNVLEEGRAYDDDVKQLIRLPYPDVCILRETTLNHTEKTWMISIASDERSEMFRSMFKWVNASVFRDSQYVFAVSSVVLYPYGDPVWVPYPVVALLDLGPIGSSGIHAVGLWRPADLLTPEACWQELHPDVRAVSNLCVMLALHNVTSREVSPSLKIIKRRAKRGKRPLFSYHVLSVNGEIWDSPVSGTTTTNGVRSHLRRGHIRRLHDGRQVWVRSTLVRGAVPGFVAKDYAVMKP